MTARLALVALLATAACEPRVRPDYPEPTWEDDERAGVAPADEPGPRGAPLRASRGEITRAGLLSVLDAGPAAFLRRVDMEPTFVSNRFAGWQIVAFRSDDHAFQTVDLVPGDVVIAVNGRSLERPEQLHELWEALRTATRLEVDYVRNGEVRRLHYEIQN